MSLSDVEINWFARQVVIPGFGAHGQHRLLNAAVFACGHPVGVETALSYAHGTGIRTVGPREKDEILCVIAAGIDDLDDESFRRLRNSDVPVIWYALREGILTGGVSSAGAPLPDRIAPQTDSRASALLVAGHRLAGCDAVGSAVCVILDWPLPERFEVRLG